MYCMVKWNGQQKTVHRSTVRDVGHVLKGTRKGDQKKLTVTLVYERTLDMLL